MQKRNSINWGCAILLFVATSAGAENNKIQAFLSPQGRVVFTNLVDNTPAPVRPVIPEEKDILAEAMPAPLNALVTSISQTHGVDPALVRAVMKTESNFNRWAVSSKGALGLMQLIPSTGRRYGVRDFYDPQQNIDAGVRHLKFLLEKFNGNLDLSLAAYNAGENLVEKLGRVPPILETTTYVRKIRAIYKKKAPVVSAPATSIAAVLPVQPAPTAVMAKDEAPKIFKSVDERGVVHFSNIEPPN